jgi:uncharacterized Zn-binding protein involved in type VI secretion
MTRATFNAKAQILLGDTTTHGGVVISGSPTNSWNGIPVARQGDQVICPLCSPHIFVITEGLPQQTDTAAKLPLAVEGHLTGCGATLMAVAAPPQAAAQAQQLLDQISPPAAKS